jgi:hypothetical protein
MHPFRDCHAFEPVVDSTTAMDPARTTRPNRPSPGLMVPGQR